VVKISNIPPMGRATRRPGLLVQTKTRGGVPIMKGWPKKRGKKATPDQKHNQEQFALAQRAANECHPWQYLEAAAMSEGTIWNRREILVKAAQGSLFDIVIGADDYYGNWFEMAREIQALLDTVSDVPGTMLVRNAEGWVGLEPGVDGYVLSTNGEGFPPHWIPVSVPTPSYQWSAPDISAAYGNINITVGNQYTPAFDVEISDVSFRLTPDVGKTYSLTIATINAGNDIIAVLQQFDITAAVFANPNGVQIPLPVAQTLTAGIKYAFLLSKSNGPTGAGIKLFDAFQGNPPFPLQARQGSLIRNVAVPAAGQNYSPSAGIFGISLKWREL